MSGSASVWLTDGMFVRDEVPLDVGFEVARDRLANLDSWFLTASDHAYGEGIAGLARIGPRGSTPGMSRLAEIRFQSLAAGDGRPGLALRWEARGPGGRLFPVLDADLTLAPAGENAALLTLAGAYRPPLGGRAPSLTGCFCIAWPKRRSMTSLSALRRPWPTAPLRLTFRRAHRR